MKYADACEIACGSEIRLRRVKERILFHIATKEQYFTIAARKLFHIRRKPNISLEMFMNLWYNEVKKGGVTMIFNTHDRTPKIKTNKTLKIMLISCWSFIGAVFLFFAIATSIMSHSILPAAITLIPVTFIAAFVIVTTIDMNKAYIQIDGENITVVDYYFFSRKEKCFTIDEIKTAEIEHGYSFRVRGYRYSMMGFSYIVFRNDNNKYLFKVINCPETNDFFSKYIQIQ